MKSLLIIAGTAKNAAEIYNNIFREKISPSAFRKKAKDNEVMTDKQWSRILVGIRAKSVNLNSSVRVQCAIAYSNLLAINNRDFSAARLQDPNLSKVKIKALVRAAQDEFDNPKEYTPPQETQPQETKSSIDKATASPLDIINEAEDKNFSYKVRDNDPTLDENNTPAKKQTINTDFLNQ